MLRSISVKILLNESGKNSTIIKSFIKFDCSNTSDWLTAISNPQSFNVINFPRKIKLLLLTISLQPAQFLVIFKCPLCNKGFLHTELIRTFYGNIHRVGSFWRYNNKPNEVKMDFRTLRSELNWYVSKYGQISSFFTFLKYADFSSSVSTVFVSFYAMCPAHRLLYLITAMIFGKTRKFQDFYHFCKYPRSRHCPPQNFVLTNQSVCSPYMDTHS
jgi:hypothetical protein